MGKHGVGPSKGAVEQNMQRGAWEPLFSADHMRNPHVMVVHHVGQVIGRQPIGLHEHLVVQHAALERDLAANGIVQGDGFVGVGCFETNHVRDSIGLQSVDFFGGKVEAVPQVAARGGIVLPNVWLRGLAQCVEFFGGVKGQIGHSLVQKSGHSFLVQRAALALAVWPDVSAGLHPFVRRQPAPCQGLFDVGFGAFYEASLVGVFHPQDEGSAVGACEQPIVQCSADPAHVERTRRAWGKSYSNVHGRQR